MLGKFFDGSLRHVSTLVLVALLVAVLVAPPVSLLDRVDVDFMPNMLTRSVSIPSQTGGMIKEEDTGAALIFLPEQVQADFAVTFSRIVRDNFDRDREWSDRLALLPSAGLTHAGDLFLVSGMEDLPDQSVTLQVPYGDISDLERLKLVSWQADRWRTLPSTQIRDETLVEAHLDRLPDNFLLVLDHVSHVPEVTLLLTPEQVPARSDGIDLAQVNAVGVSFSRLRGDGGLEGEIPQMNPDQPMYLVLGNTEPDGTVRSDLLINLVVQEGLIQNQLIAVSEAFQSGNGQVLQGVILDYQGLSLQPAAGGSFTAFAGRLKQTLEAIGRPLVIRVEPPRKISDSEWDTLGYDWSALSEIADGLIVPSPLNPEAYRPGFDFESLLRFATGRVERHKLAIELQTNPVAIADNAYHLLPFSDTVRTMMGQLTVKAVDDTLIMRMDRAHLIEEPVYDPLLHQYHFGHLDPNLGPMEVHVIDAASLRYKLSVLHGHNISRAVLDMTGHVDVDAQLWPVLAEFRSAQEMALLPAEYKIGYDVSHQGEAKAHLSASFDEADRSFPVSGSGSFTVEANLYTNGPVVAGTRDQVDIQVQVSSLGPSSTTSSATTPVLVPGPNVNLAAHSGPGRNSPIADRLTQGKEYDIVGRNNDTSWIQIEDERGVVGWVAVFDASEHIVNRELVRLLQVVNPIQVADTTSTSVGVGTAGSPSPLWGYGVQAHLFEGEVAQAMLMTRQMGFNWMKQQIRWNTMETVRGQIDYTLLDGVQGEASRNGLNLLFSVLAAPDWAREPSFEPAVVGPPADYSHFASFVGQLAGRYCNTSVKAIEVWNEQNLHYEWGNLPLEPADYVRMLKSASAEIKRQCPSMLVVSGALTPTGTNQTQQSRGGWAALDDLEYLRQSLQQGMLSYVDAVGAHPSGYNIPPSYTAANYCSIMGQYGNTHFDAGCNSNNPHRSFSFRSTMESYRELVAQYDASKPIWPTEFGWAVNTGAAYRGYDYALDNDFSEQAAWTVEAYQMMKDWGWVAAPILWNLNYRVIASSQGTEREQWGIVQRDWTPLPVYTALKEMPK